MAIVSVGICSSLYFVELQNAENQSVGYGPEKEGVNGN